MIRVVVGEDTCAGLPSLRAAVAQARPDVVLTDIRMPPTMTDERSGPFRAWTQVPGVTGLASCRRGELVDAC